MAGFWCLLFLNTRSGGGGRREATREFEREPERTRIEARAGAPTLAVKVVDGAVGGGKCSKCSRVPSSPGLRGSAAQGWRAARKVAAGSTPEWQLLVCWFWKAL